MSIYKTIFGQYNKYNFEDEELSTSENSTAVVGNERSIDTENKEDTPVQELDATVAAAEYLGYEHQPLDASAAPVAEPAQLQLENSHRCQKESVCKNLINIILNTFD